MNKRFFLILITLFTIVGMGNAQNCITVTSATVTNPSNDHTTWDLNIIYTADGTKSLEIQVFCGNDPTPVFTDCLETNGDGSKTYPAAVICANGSANISAKFTPHTGNCKAAACGPTQIFPSGSLPVTFEKITAVRDNNQIKINWTTASETNCKEYVVEGSRDNVNWTAIGKLDSKAVNGTSSTPLDYSLSIGLPVAMAALGMGGLFLLTLVRSRWARALVLVVIVLAAGACLKDGQTVDVEKGAVGYVRIAQYDKDSNTPHYSKVIKVVND
ncbi:hypothetical protein [Niabella drilacis]|uniref:Uncharacterized protein n=1 Tax=Niabella drilacis (strain DSM 25811 / CCM 8410 / CCUG 62505 / LMG 26954 / E90) TaxID=1285928 RepID=A0A1G6ZXH0_NIADE|nr:hypothetical protein [Niabella drilacis]SDE07374.1 hypothetical protein SAMN04487894_1205 [Niabella drilacis]